MSIIENIIASLFLSTRSSRKSKGFFKNMDVFRCMNLQRDNNEIYGYINNPQNPDTCYVILHGTSENRKVFTQNYNLIDKMNPDQLYYIPDYRQFGESRKRFEINAVLEDIGYSLKYIADKYAVNNFQIIGQLMGATLSLYFYHYYLRHKSEFGNVNITKVVAFSPFYSTRKAIDFVLEILIERSCCVVSVVLRLLRNIINVPQRINFDFDELEYLDNFSSNVHLVCGKPDDVVSYKNTIMLAKKFGFKYFVDEDLGHVGLFKSEKYWKRLINI